MNDYEASSSRIEEKIITAAQCIKENLTCRICLELFDLPVTIKCGHRFCRDCILRVTSNENSSCPFCNTKIQKRSIPKEGNAILQASVNKFENLIKAIQSDSGIDVLQPQNKIKHTKESTADYAKPSTSKVQDTPSTSKGSSSILSRKLTKPTKSYPAKSRLSLTNRKSDLKSPNQSSDKNTLHKYLSNKSDAVSDLDLYSQEKVKNWLENCASDHNDDVTRNSVQVEIESLGIIPDQLSTPPHQTDSSPQQNQIKEPNANQAPASETSSESKYKETHMRIKETEMKAKKKNTISKDNEKVTVITPNSVPASSHSDAIDWNRIKRGGREMQARTFKTLDLSKEKCSPTLPLDDTVPYNSTNNDSKSISRDFETNNSYINKTPLENKKLDPLKSENNNLLKKSPQIVIEDYKSRSLDSTTSPKQEYVAALNVDENQLNEIIGVVPSTSIPKTSERVVDTSKPVDQSNSHLKINPQSPLKHPSNSGQEFSGQESTNCSSKTAINDLQNLPPKKSRLSLKRNKISANSKISSSPNAANNINGNETESLNHLSLEKSKRQLLLGLSDNKIKDAAQQSGQIISRLSNNLSRKCLSSSSSGARFIFKKLGKICKKKQNVPFIYLGKLDKEKCLYSISEPQQKIRPVIKSSVPVQVDHKVLLQIQTDVEEFSSDVLPSYSISEPQQIIKPVIISSVPVQVDHKVLLQIQTDMENFSSDVLHSKQTKTESHLQIIPQTKYFFNEEAMTVDKDVVDSQLDQQMEIDETLPPAKLIVKNNNNQQMKKSKYDGVDTDKLEDLPLKASVGVRNVSEDKDSEKIPQQIDENSTISSRSTYKRNKNLTENKNCNPIPTSSSKVDTIKKSSSIIQSNDLSYRHGLKKVDDVNKIPDDRISISSDDSVVSKKQKPSAKKVDKMNCNKSSTKCKSVVKKSDVGSCTDSEVSVASSIRNKENVEDTRHRYSSTSSSSLKNVKKKRTHSESSNDEEDVVDIIDRWIDPNKEHSVAKKAKILVDSEEMLNVTKRKRKSKISIDSSSDDEVEETFLENKQQHKSLVNDKAPQVKNQVIEANTDKLVAMPSSMLSADLFESNEQSIQPSAQIFKKQGSEIDNKTASSIHSDSQSDKENIMERSRENITVIDTRLVKRRKSIVFENNEDKENKENNERNQTFEHIQSIKTAEENVDEIENSQKDKNKSVNNFEHETDPYFVRESLINVTQEQLACKNIEKDLFGVDLSKLPENQNENTSDSDKCSTPRKNVENIFDGIKFSTPRRKPKDSEENDDFDSDNIEATPVARRRHTFRCPSSGGNMSQMFSPIRRTNLIPAITPMRNTKCYPVCHSTPIINNDSSEIQIYSQVETIKLVCSSLSAENTRLVNQFANKFNAKLQANFDPSVTHVVVKVDPETKTPPKTFKYIQGIAYKKYVVSLEWIKDCIVGNKLVDPDDEKYDVLDPDILVSGSKRSRQSAHDLFENFVFCFLEPFEKVSLSELKELLSYNGGEIVTSFAEFHLHKDRLKVIIVESDEINEESTTILNKCEAAVVFFEWAVDCLSQYQLISIASYLWETTIEKARRLGFPAELLIEEETMEEEDDQ